MLVLHLLGMLSCLTLFSSQQTQQLNYGSEHCEKHMEDKRTYLLQSFNISLDKPRYFSNYIFDSLKQN